jgi:hypothetical protein
MTVLLKSKNVQFEEIKMIHDDLACRSILNLMQTCKNEEGRKMVL